MRRHILAFALAFLTPAWIFAAQWSPLSGQPAMIDHTQWIATSLIEMQTIKVGMTRMDLLKIFKEEGGLSTVSSRTYAYKHCAYIKVDVEFELIGPPSNSGIRSTESSQDKIIRISKPFLDGPTYD